MPYTPEQTIGHLTMFLVHFVEQANIDPKKTAFDIDSPIIGAPPTIVTLADVLTRAQAIMQRAEVVAGVAPVDLGDASELAKAEVAAERMGLGGSYNDSLN
jgi:hypothetical protein